jgi:hypothetical protein
MFVHGENISWKCGNHILMYFGSESRKVVLIYEDKILSSCKRRAKLYNISESVI